MSFPVFDLLLAPGADRLPFPSLLNLWSQDNGQTYIREPIAVERFDREQWHELTAGIDYSLDRSESPEQ
ncbi:MAG: hypothetical protein R3350_00740, partial [Saprospiraceae bacterium]|nr:hypothetical protein [Saprospiraceae bacterium]